MSDHQAGGGTPPPRTLNLASGQAVRVQQVYTTASPQNVNLLTNNGQQFVITSQVPGLTQVIPTIATSSASLQQGGVTRILNISPSSRVGVVGVSQVPGRGGALQISGNGEVTGRGAVSLVAIGQPTVNASSHPTLVSSLSSPPRQRTSGVMSMVQATSPTLVLATSTSNLVRTSGGSFATPVYSTVTNSSSPTQPPPRKRARQTEVPVSEEVGTLRRHVLDSKTVQMKRVRERYAEHAAELFFLQAGGNVMDYHAWRKRPATPQFLHFLRSYRLDPEDDDEDLTQALTSEVRLGTPVASPMSVATTSSSQSSQSGATTSAVENSVVTVGVTNVQSTAGRVAGPSNSLPDKVPAPSLSLTKQNKRPLTTQTAPRQNSRHYSISALYDHGLGSQEQIAEKAKQEAYVMQRIAELQREGLWSEKRLPKVQEPPRSKAHWDYLIEEMVWLAADFAQERKWKKAAAKKCARSIQKYFQEKEIQAQKAEKMQELRLKKLASFQAKEIKTFWANVEKLVEYKQQTRLEEKRKKALDQHLSFIVDQTEKYSTWLAESMNKPGGDRPNASGPVSVNSSRRSSPSRQGHASDDEFQPNQTSSDDEETIAKAEEEDEEHVDEVEMLTRHGEMSMEDVLKELPDNYLQEREKMIQEEVLQDENQSTDLENDEESLAGDEDFRVSDNSQTTDDETIQEEDLVAGPQDHAQELEELQADNEMSIEELMAKYAVDRPQGDESADEDHDEQEDDESSDGSDVEMQEVSDLKSLMEDSMEGSSVQPSSNEDAGKEINDVAALAESIQPKGNTLSSTSVVTPIPFLLKHTLREYQHIGLDWLVTMYDRKLNGILADEMGLGKTIQTISLLAHLACEKVNWGPHLIIVPTSVMLNWEMELKKWCPAFKILTYYGTQKERKQKRTGWTKPNAFHICITSYKLVIQDHQSFRRKKWKYLILDEAQNIKNFKSQRWQLLLNFQTQRRLLLTGTPLQNNLMELWSLMHFLMPSVFQSHREFKEWFSNPVSGMIEGNSEYNESLIKRLHKVLRPFLLRRLKTEVEKQLPKKYEHIVMCRLSKRQRYLYDDFMSRAKTRETLATGNLLSVINVLMQLRKVCNHPNLFEARPIVSPFQMEGLTYYTASLVTTARDFDPFRHVDLFCLNLLLVELELCLTAFVAHRIKKFRTPKKLIEEIDSVPEPPPRCPSGKIRIHVRLSNTAQQQQQQQQRAVVLTKPPRVGTSPVVRTVSPQPQGGVTLRVAGGTQLQGYSVQLVPHPGGVKAIPVAALGPGQPGGSNTTSSQPQALTGVQVKQGDGVQRISVPAGFAQLVQTSTGRHILLTSSPQVVQPLAQNQVLPGTTTVVTAGGQRLTVLSKPVAGVATTAVTRVVAPGLVTAAVTRPVMRVPPLNVSPGAVTTTVTTTTTTTATKTSTALTQPMLAALVQQARNGTSTQPTPGVLTRHEAKNLEEKKREVEETKSVFHQPELEEKKRRRRRDKLEMIARFNRRRCDACPIYGADLREALDIMNHPQPNGGWESGYIHCRNAVLLDHRPQIFWTQTEALHKAVLTPERRVAQLQDVFARFVLFVPAVATCQPQMHVSHPPPSRLWEQQRFATCLQREVSPRASLLHPIASSMATQFPEPRLIQYDCGKLQVLDRLLRRLKAEQHRALIFTQMTRMLDVLEAFLNFHGYIYLRLDGTTRIDQRQILMERFNADRRIFCFILSTRSGGIGVNLTGADTVIFYDSDWNPTMDAQAQDRCHRIGQTRDVHIYRLVSEMTVEENILKKANQKRLLGDVAIEGGNFTTAYFKSSTIQDLFNIDVDENSASRRMAEVLERDDRRRAKDEVNQLPLSPNEDKVALGALESALAAVEDETDVQAAKTAKAEAAADLAEFDETIPLEEGDAAAPEQEVSKVEQELNNLVQQLTPIERYAMRFVEATEAAWAAEAAAEAEIEQQKREWELGRLRAMREEEERRERLAEEEEPRLTYSREDALNQIWVSDDGREQMPMWCPPTPPQDGNDVYIDHAMGFLYEQTTMSESQLPPVYVRKEHKRTRVEAAPVVEREGRRAVKMRHKEESMYAPRSLFDRPSSTIAKLRRDMKLQKCRGIVRTPVPIPGLKPPTPVKQVQEPENVPEWMIHEDWALLQAVQSFLELPLNLLVLSPGHTPNWDLVADLVNNVSRIYRSPKQCRSRYECVIVPREEGKMMHDMNTKKQKKTKNLYKIPPQTKATRPQRTSQLFLQDNNTLYTQLYVQRFESIKAVSNKRTPTVKPLLVNPALRNPKHAAVLAENNIVYDNPLSPIEVAIKRAERIAKEKQKTAAAAVQVLSGEQHLAVQRPQAQAQATAVQQPSKAPTPSPAPTPGPSPASQAVVVGLSQAPATVVQAGAAATLTKRPIATLTMQDVVAAAARSSPAVVTVASLSSAQVQAAAQRLATVSATTAKGVVTTTVAGKAQLSPAQLQMYRQQALLRQQQQQQQTQQRLRDLKALQAQQAAGGTVAAVQVSQAGTPRAQFVKQTAGGKQTIARTMSETEMAMLIKRQQQQLAQQQKGQLAVPTAAGLTPAAALLAQAGLQVQQAGPSSQGQVATLVKTVTPGGSQQSVTIPMAMPQVKTATPQQQQQIRQQLAIHQQLLQRKLPAQKVAQLTQVAGKGGLPAQLIVQSQKVMPTTMTVQQVQQVIKHAQHLTHVSGAQAVTTATGGQVVLAKSSQARVVPASSSQQPMKQTIQVVTASPGRGTVPNVTVDSAGRPQVSVASTLASALAGTIKVASSTTTQQQQQLLSQVNAALRQTQSPGRPLVALVQQPAAQQPATSSQNQQDQAQ